MEEYTIDNLLLGITYDIEITSYGKSLKVPFAVYKTALATTVSDTTINTMKHDITFKIDGVEIRDVGRIIKFMYYSAYGPLMTEVTYKPYNMSELRSNLIMDLGIINWCDILYNSSKTYINYKNAIILSIKNAVDIVRALLSDDVKHVGGHNKRLEILINCGIGYKMPPFIETQIVLPAPKQGLSKILKNGGELYVSDHKIKNTSSTYLYDKDNDFTISTNDFANMQNRIKCELLSREIQLRCRGHPEYLKIDNFGPECENIITTMIEKHDDLLLHSSMIPDGTIFDVFRHGLDSVISGIYKK